MNTPLLALVSGGFDPIHSGHVAFIQATVESVGEVVVLLNSDKWLERKKGHHFMHWTERATVLRAMRGVKDVIAFDDGDKTSLNGIIKANQLFGKDHALVFCNGGDRDRSNTPETALCEALGIKVAWDLGGRKLQSSSDLLWRWHDLHKQGDAQ